MKHRSKWCLLGVPDQAGVMNVGGRVGTTLGPDALRRHLHRVKSRHVFLEHMDDLGNAGPFTSLVEANHQLVAQRVSQSFGEYKASVLVGGGHDHGYSHLKGIRELLPKKKRLGCINLDAHLDLRRPSPKITSGSPFYLAIEHEVLDPACFIEFGIQEQCNALELWEYVRQQRIQVITFSELRFGRALGRFKKALTQLARRCDEIVISLDLDCLAHAHAPGVSAPVSEGFTPSEIFALLSLAAKHPKVRSLGIFELNPLHDIEEATARLAATSVFHFIHESHSRDR